MNIRQWILLFVSFVTALMAHAVLAPELVAQVGHRDDIYRLVFSPDGKMLASSAGDNTAIIWDVTSGAQIRTFGGQTQSVDALAFSPDGMLLATGSDDHSVRLWRVATGELLWLYQYKQDPVGVWSLAFSADGQLLAAMTGSVILLDTATGQEHLKAAVPQTQGTLVGAISIAWGPNDASLWLGGTHSVMQIDAITGKLLKEAPGLSVPLGTYISAGRAGSVVGAGREQGGICVWQDLSAPPVIAIDGFGPLAVCAEKDLGVCAQPRSTIYKKASNIAQLIDLKTGKVLRTFTEEFRGGTDQYAKSNFALRALALSSDGIILATSSQVDASIFLWNVATGECLRVLGGNTTTPLVLAASPNSQLLASGDTQGNIVLWDMEQGVIHRTLFGHGNAINALAFSPDGTRLASGSRDLTARVWDTETGACVHVLDHDQWVTALAFNPDGHALATGVTQVRIWNTDDGSLTATLGDPASRSRLLGLHFDDIMTVRGVSDTGDIFTCDIQDGTTQRTFQLQRGLMNALISADGSRFYAPYDNSFILASVDGKRVYWAKSPYNSQLYWNGIAETTGGASVAWACDGPVVLLTDDSGKTIRQLTGHSARTTGIAFTPDGRLLASGSYDGTIRLWRMPEGETVAMLVAVDGGKGWLVATPQGYYDCSLEADRMVCWRFGDQIFPFDRFSKKYLRPDIVKRALAGEDLSALPALSLTDIPPTLHFDSPAYGTESAEAGVRVTLSVTGSAPIERVDLTVNGQPVPRAVADQLVEVKPVEKTKTYTITVPLPTGTPRVRLRAVAYDVNGLKSNVDELLLYRPAVKTTLGTLRVLAIGIDRYERPDIPSLHYAAVDARALAAAFNSPANRLLYQDIKTRVITDADATLTNLTFALRDLKDTATENDVVVVFLAGHGVRDRRGNFFFGSTAMDMEDLPNTALAWTDFIAVLRDVRARRLLVLADTCHAGAIVGDTAATGEELARKLNEEAHRLAFVACSRDEDSIATADWGHGAFTKALLEALGGATDAVNADGALTFRGLRDYVMKRTEVLTDGRQHPQLPFLDDFEPEAVLANTR